MYLCVCTCMCVCMHVFACVRACVCMCVFMYVNVCASVRTCVTVWEHMLVTVYTVQVTILITTISSTTDFIVQLQNTQDVSKTMCTLKILLHHAYFQFMARFCTHGHIRMLQCQTDWNAFSPCMWPAKHRKTLRTATHLI